MSKKEKKPMTNAKKSVLITLLVLIVLGVSTAVLLLMPPTDTEPAATDSSQTQSEDESSEEEEDNSISLLSKKASEVDHIDVVNQNTSFTLRPREDSKESSSESSADTDDLDSAFFSVDGLDPVMRRQVWSLLMSDVAEYGTTVLVSSHNLRELEDVCDHVGILSHGKVLVERSLSDLQENVVKMQVVFQEKELPQLPADLEILHVSQVGRIHTLIIRGNATDITNRLAVYAPILMDALPLTLEEIFIYELGGEDYEVRDIVL